MSDTNIVLHLRSGEEVKVIYPNRVFHEWHTPWLEEPGCVQTCNAAEKIAKRERGNLVISTWRNFPKYLSQTDGRLRTIPIANITGVAPADAADAEIGNQIRQAEFDAQADESYKEQYIRRSDLAEILNDLLRPDLATKILTRPRS